MKLLYITRLILLVLIWALSNPTKSAGLLSWLNPFAYGATGTASLADAHQQTSNRNSHQSSWYKKIYAIGVGTLLLSSGVSSEKKSPSQASIYNPYESKLPIPYYLRSAMLDQQKSRTEYASTRNKKPHRSRHRRHKNNTKKASADHKQAAVNVKCENQNQNQNHQSLLSHYRQCAQKVNKLNLEVGGCRVAGRHTCAQQGLNVQIDHCNQLIEEHGDNITALNDCRVNSKATQKQLNDCSKNKTNSDNLAAKNGLSLELSQQHLHKCTNELESIMNSSNLCQNKNSQLSSMLQVCKATAKAKAKAKAKASVGEGVTLPLIILASLAGVVAITVATKSIFSTKSHNKQMKQLNADKAKLEKKVNKAHKRLDCLHDTALKALKTFAEDQDKLNERELRKYLQTNGFGLEATSINKIVEAYSSTPVTHSKPYLKAESTLNSKRKKRHSPTTLYSSSSDDSESEPIKGSKKPLTSKACPKTKL